MPETMPETMFDTWLGLSMTEQLDGSYFVHHGKDLILEEDYKDGHWKASIWLKYLIGTIEAKTCGVWYDDRAAARNDAELKCAAIINEAQLKLNRVRSILTAGGIKENAPA